MNISRAFIEIANRAGREHGTPLPRRLVSFGSDSGWMVTLNPLGDESDGLPPYTAKVEYSGTPIGFIDPCGGCLIGGGEGETSTEDDLIAWCESDLNSASNEPPKKCPECGADNPDDFDSDVRSGGVISSLCHACGWHGLTDTTSTAQKHKASNP